MNTNHTTYTLRDEHNGGTYTAVTVINPVWGLDRDQYPMHLMGTHELNRTRPMTECGMRTRHGLVQITDEVTKRGACEECQHVLTARSA